MKVINENNLNEIIIDEAQKGFADGYEVGFEDGFEAAQAEFNDYINSIRQ